MLFTSWLSDLRTRRSRSRRSASRLRLESGCRSLRQGAEQLETRQLLTAPRFVSISPNVGEFITDGVERNEAPRELVIQFSPGQTLNAATLGAVQIYAAENDGAFRPASTVTDFGTSGAVILRVGTGRLGAAENGTILTIARQDLMGLGPTVTAAPGSITLTLDSNVADPTTAQDLLNFVATDPAAGASLSVELVSGNPATVIASSAVPNRTLSGAGAASALSSFGAGSGFLMQFTARTAGEAGNLISLQFIRRNLGASSSVPQLNVVGNRIEVTLNNNPAQLTTAQGLIAAINGNVAANALISASVPVGLTTTSLAGIADGTILHLSGADNLLTPGYRALDPDNLNQVIYRFADTLSDDTYRVQIVGAGTNPLRNTSAEVVDSSADTRVTFTINPGAQVHAVVPQPVLRDQVITIVNPSQIADGDILLVDPGTQTAHFASVSSDLGSSAATSVTFTAVDGGTYGNNIRVVVTRSDLGAGIAPEITVAGREIQIRLNSNATTPTTAAGLVAAVGSDTAASGLVGASATVGAVNIGLTAPALSILTTAGGMDALAFEFNRTDSATPTGQPGNNTIDFTSATTASALAGLVAAAINTRTTELRGVTAIPSGAQVTVRGTAFDPRVTRSITTGTALTLAAGGLTQATDTAVVYFNQDRLDLTDVHNPSFYQLVNAATGQITLPQSITYSPASNTAVLKFAAALPTAEYELRTGSSAEPNGVTDGAIDIGSLFLNRQFQQTSYLGDINSSSTDSSDVDLFKFDLTSASTVSVTTAPSAGLDSVIRLFDSTGMQLQITDTAGAGSSDSLTSGVLAAGTYYLGVSATGNTAYDPVAGTTAAGTGSGSYQLTVANTTLSISNTDINSSFATAVNVGLLGSGGVTFNGQIQPQTTILMPALPGGADEPGHRELPPADFTVERFHGVGTGVASYAPSGIGTITYSFPNAYGFDPQGNVLFNAITDNQRQRTREIFELFARYTGMEVMEVTAGGIGVVTGDIRAIAPQLDPSAVGGIAGGGLAIMNASIDWGQSEFGGAWMGTALHEIGHAVGLGHSYDVHSTQGASEDPSVAALPPVEAYYTGEHDLIHLRRLYRPDSSDIDLFRFTLDAAGQVNAEVLAERSNSNLNAVLQLYREETISGQIVRTLVARNDDYYSNDPSLTIDLEAGTYYLGISASGNDNYNPSIADSGQGGTTDGAYQLRVNVSRDASGSLSDATGQAFDGDSDGKSGGTNSFWFRTGSTIFVDKTYTGTETGSITQPFNEIDQALAASTSGQIVRIVGNGGTDNSLATVADNRSYQVGLSAQGAILTDGAEFKVPQGVTVMIDAGALIKLRGAVIDVGTSAVGVDRSAGAIQVLGTTLQQAFLTSFRDDARGGNDDGVNGVAGTGDWGGIVLRGDSDSTTAGVFLNYINHATIQYGGGQVSIGSLQVTFDPISIIDTRPTVSHNTISLSASAPISASPDSFDDSNGRIGPDIHGNTVSGNSFNGLFIKIETSFGLPVDRLNVQARFDDTDIVHIITENLHINGNAGGGLNGQARLSGRLAVDPGVIVKLQNSRIEAERGASHVIAEGTPQDRIRFTSLLDDRFGAGGTFDTTSDGATAAAAGNWGGFMFDEASSGHFDNVSVTYGGGTTPISGGFDNFNAMEVVQGDLRVSNSFFENNAGGQATSTREGRGSNDSSTIYVRGSQPALVNNVFRNNVGNVISINANSMRSDEMSDTGRTTGFLDVTSSFIAGATPGSLVFDDTFRPYAENSGPLVRGNRYEGNDINGMNVRGELLTIESVWDDTDIVHVLQGEVLVSEHHTYSGMRLQSNDEGSLVIKLSGATAGFTATGDPLDINDRIGGAVQVIGRPGFPVILTSIHDDTVGAGFLPSGFPLTDTNGNGPATAPGAGNWRSIQLRQFSNDRNVRTVLESESPATTGNETNNTPTNAEFLGVLAPDEMSGDENRRLGFEVHGTISSDAASDVDVYSFRASGQTEIWIDIDRSTDSLDTMVEIVDAIGNVLARTLDNSTGDLAGTSLVELPLTKDLALGGDFYTTNRMDAGMRVVLPGSASAIGTYYVRVRSQPVAGQENNVTGGLTTGRYQMQVRLRQVDEKPGSTVRNSEIRYATNGVEVIGMPGHSPLLAESAEDSTVNNARDQAQELGALLVSDRNTLSVGGNLGSRDDVDFYSFTLDYEQVQVISGGSDGGKTWATVFDIDYADGIGNPDTTLAVFDSTGTLLWIGRDSDVADDQPNAQPGQGTDLDDLSRGTVGKLDAYIGGIQMIAGASLSPSVDSEGLVQTPAASRTRYFVAVSSNGTLPTVLNATFQSAGAASLVRLEPVNGIRRVVEDHIGFTGYTSNGAPQAPTTVGPLVDISSDIALSTHVTPFSLQDVSLFTTSAGNHSIINPSTGASVVNLGQTPTQTSFDDIAMRTDGRLYGYSNASYVQLNGDGSGAGAGSDGIPYRGGATSSNAMAYRLAGNNNYELFIANNSNWDQDGDNNTGNEALPSLFRADSGSGAVRDENTGANNIQPVGGLPIGTIITGLAFDAYDSTTLFAVDNAGTLYRTTVTGGTGNPTSRGHTGWTTVLADVTGTGTGFTGLTLGPQNVEGGIYADLFFASTASGRLYAFDTTGALQTVFDSNSDGVADATFVTIGGSNGQGLAFSPLDFNLWHPTLRRRADQGHGVNTAPDNSRAPGAEAQPINSRVTAEGEGGASLYFGLEQFQNNPTTADGYFRYNGGEGQLGVLDAILQRELTTGGTPANANTYNLAGGANGSVITNSFSLESYRNTDKPTLYFNYFLATQDAGSLTNGMRDSARASISTDGGATWELLATNNSTRSTAGMADGELPAFASTSRLASDQANQQVQELFDNTGGWRQARIDLNDYVGEASLILRFDFSTSGVSRNPNATDYIANAGDTFGDFSAANRGSNNAFEGFYVDDIIVGFAERGEMVSYPTGAASTNSSYFTLPVDADPMAATEQLSGDYQLEIRRGEEYQTLVAPTDPDTAIFNTLDTNERLVIGQTIFAGDSATDGDTITVTTGFSHYATTSGTGTTVLTFEFNDPAGATPTVTAGNVAINFTPGSGKGALATAIANAINGVAGFGVYAQAYSPGTNSGQVNLTGSADVSATVAPLATAIDLGVPAEAPIFGNDLPAFAFASGIDTGTPATYALAGRVGDGPMPAGQDIDLISITMNAGDLVQIDLTVVGGIPTQSLLAIYDNAGFPGSPLATSLTGSVSYRAPATGTYFIGVADTDAAAVWDYRLDITAGALPVATTVESHDRLGDQNLHRQQGQVILENNLIRNSSQYGIRVVPGNRDAGTAVSHPGSPHIFDVTNINSVVTGVYLTNNTVARSGTGGVLISGDANPAGNPQAAVPFVKVVNNTIYGGDVRTGIGFDITNNSSPTLLNNIIANTTTGIRVINGSAAVIGTTVFSNNTATGPVGTNEILLAAGDPLFVNPLTNNFYLASGSQAIDSSLNSLAERTDVHALLSPLGIPDSPIFAPEFDLYGQLRQDDGNQNPAPGLGSNIVKDRGSVERADFDGGIASLVIPEDNGPLDLEDTLLDVVHIDQPSFFNQIVVKLVDTGIGIDDASVAASGSQFVLVQTLRSGTTTLQAGVDYIFAYNSNTNEAIFTAVTVFPSDARFALTVDNSAATGIKDFAGNTLIANQLDGSLRFDILVTNGANDPPVNTVPGIQTVAESTVAAPTSITFSAAGSNVISVDDPDAFIGTGILQVTLTAPNGVLTLSSITNLDFSFTPDVNGAPAGDGTADATMTFRGQISDINAALSGLLFTPTLNFNGATSITITTSDLGNFGTPDMSGSVPVEIDTDVIPINITPVNSGPVNTVPAAQTVDEDTDLIFNLANGNQIQISDAVDGNLGAMLVTLSVTNGVLTLSGTAGLTFITGTGMNNASISFTGLVADVNAALEGLRFRGNQDYNSSSPRLPAVLSLTNNDQGNTGAGAALSDTDTVTINITAINDAPVNSYGGSAIPASPAVITALERTPFLLSGATAITVADVDASEAASPDTNVVQVTLTATDATVSLGSMLGLSFTVGDGTADTTMTFTGTIAAVNTALSGSTFLPDPMFVTATAGRFATLTITTDDQGHSPAPARNDTDTLSFDVLEVNDPPIIRFNGTDTSATPAAGQTVAEEAGLVFNTAGSRLITVSDSAFDPTPTTELFQVTLSVLNGTVTLGSIPGTLLFTFSDADGTGSGDGTSDATMTFRGTIADLNTALDGLTYTGNLDYNGADTLTVTLNDRGFLGNGGSRSRTATVGITVTPVNDTPSVTAPASTNAVEATNKTFSTLAGNAIQVSDPRDAISATGTEIYQVSLSASRGVLTVSGFTGLLFSVGDGTSDAAMTFTGTLNNLNAALNGLIYRTTDSSGTDSLVVTLNDQGNVGSGGALTATATVNITIDGLNDAPVNTVPGAQTVGEDVDLFFNTVNGNAISVFDVDADLADVQVSLSVPNGTLTVGATPGVMISNNGTAAITLVGAQGSINTALQTLTFRGVLNFAGTTTLTVVTNDLGNTGTGGARSDTDTVAITVSATNDQPTISSPAGISVNEDSFVLLQSSSSNGILVNDVDLGAGKLRVTLTLTHGVITLSQMTSLTFSVGDGTSDATMTFTGARTAINLALEGARITPAAGYVGSDTLTVSVNDQGNTGSGGPQTATVSIPVTVNGVNDAPVLTVPGMQSINEDSVLTFSVPNGNPVSLSDVDAGSSAIQITLTAANGTLTLSTIDPAWFSFASDANGTAAGDGTADSTMTFRAPLANAVAALSGLTYRPGSNFNGSDSLIINVRDLGNTGSGGSLADSDSITINIAAVNDAPVNTAPAAQSVLEDTNLVFNTTNGNAISVDDVDVGGTGTVQVTLSATNGLMTLGTTSGIMLSAGDGDQDATFTFSGTRAAINTALNGLTFRPTLNYNGPAVITVTTSDLGNSGSGGVRTDIDSISITVTPDNDTPVATADTFGTVTGGTLAAVDADGTLDLDAGNNGVLFNDSDPDGDSITAVLVTPPSQHDTMTAGAFTLNPDGTFLYVHDGSSGVSDQFTYLTRDAGGLESAPVTVMITINSPPTAGDVSATIAENSPVNAPVASVVASDPNSGDTLTYSITGGNTGNAFKISSSGQISVNNPAALDYESTPTFILTVEVRDNVTIPGAAGVDTATVIVDLTDAAEAVTVGPGSFTNAGVTVRLDGSRVRFLETGTGNEVQSAHELANITSLTFTGRAALNDQLTVDFAGGNPIPLSGLNYEGGTGGSDSLIVTGGGSFNSVIHTFSSAQSGTVNIDGSIVRYTGLEPVTDNLTATTREFVYGSGNDTVTLSDDGIAGNGRSVISSPSSETVTFTAPGVSLRLQLGGGSNTLTATALDSALTASLSVFGGVGVDHIDLGGLTVRSMVIGDDGNDVILGGHGADSLRGDLGDDIIDGRGGDDTLLGGSGFDTLTGGAGVDFVSGQGGSRDVVRESVAGTVAVTATQTTLNIAGAGVNTLDRVERIEIIGSAGADVIDLQASEITAPYLLAVLAGGGNDTVLGSAMAESIDGEAGDDSLRGGDGNDTLVGGADNDMLNGGFGDDRLEGGSGADSLFGDNGADSLFGGAGNDRIDGQGSVGDIFYLNVSGNVSITSGQVITSSEGVDTIVTSTSSGSLTTTTERLWIIGDGTNSRIDASLFIGRGGLTAFGGAGNDTIIGTANSDQISGEDGNDVIDAADGNDVADGGNGADAIRGGRGDDRLIGKSGNDTLLGGDGRDVLEGGQGSDVLLGEGGVDTILPGTERDTVAASGNGTMLEPGDSVGNASSLEIDEAFSFNFNLLLL